MYVYMYIYRQLSLPLLRAANGQTPSRQTPTRELSNLRCKSAQASQMPRPTAVTQSAPASLPWTPGAPRFINQTAFN